MAQTRIKVCGVKSVEIAEAAAEAGADYVGLNFVEASPRYVEPDAACEIVAALRAGRPRVTPVGLFADHSADHVNAVARRVGLGTVQLHGSPTFENVDYMLQLPGLQIIKALAFRGGPVDPQFRQFRFPDMLLFDAPAVAGAKTSGGSGRTLDWHRLVPYVRPIQRPVFLAGGLTPDNVAEAIATVRPWAVDVSSGVERERGVKDAGLIRRFCDAVREARVRV